MDVRVGLWRKLSSEELMLLNWGVEKTLKSPLDCKESQSVHPKGDQSWVFIGRTDVEAELQYFGHLMWRADSLEKTLMLVKTEGRRRRGWQRIRWLNGITIQWTWVWVDSGSWWWTQRPGCCSSWGRKESDMTEWLNWTELNNKNLKSQKYFFKNWTFTCHSTRPFHF